MLADLDGGPVDTGGQGKFDQPAVAAILADVRVLDLDAQIVRPGVGMVGVKISLHGFVSLDAADVRSGQQLLPLGGGAPGEDRRNFGDQGIVVGLSRFRCCEAAVGQEIFPSTARQKASHSSWNRQPRNTQPSRHR